MNFPNDEEYIIRPLTTDDAEQYNALLRYAFQVTEAELAETGWKDDEIKQSKFPVLQRADVLGCFDKNELIAQFAVYPLDMNIYGIRYNVGFVTSVCTYPEYTGHGIMKKLMIQCLTRMREGHKSFALLYPYSIPLYRNLGWEIISNKMTYTIKDRQIPEKLHEPGYVRRVSWDDEEFHKLHSKFAEKTHGCLYRNNLAWEEYWRWDEDDTMVAIYYSRDGVPYGYMVYMISSDIMHVKEMILVIQLGNNILLDDSDIKETIRPYAMGRIIDIKQFFGKYAIDPDEPACVFAFDIEDELLSWNNGRFIVMFKDGHCSITSGTPDYTMKMSIATLTTMLLGYKSAEKLYSMERIETTKEAVEKLDDILYHAIPYVSDYI